MGTGNRGGTPRRIVLDHPLKPIAFLAGGHRRFPAGPLLRSAESELVQADASPIRVGDNRPHKPESPVLVLRLLDSALKGHDMPAPGKDRGIGARD